MLIRRRLPLIVLVATFVATAAFGLVFSRPGPESYDAKIMLQVTQGLVEHGDVRVTHDEFGFNTPYASYGIGMSLLFAVPYEAGRLVGHDPLNAAMTTNAFVLAFAVVAVVALARRLDLSWGRALLTGLLVGAGTMLLPYVPTGFSEPAIAALVAVGLLSVAAVRSGAGRPWAAVVGGVAGGAAVLFRTDSVLLVLPAIGGGLWFATGKDRRTRRRTLVRFGAGAAPFLAFCAWYNWFRFGSPFRLGYKDTAGFSYPFVRGLKGLLISPGRGLVWYVPLVVVALVGTRRAWRRDPVLTAAAGVILVARPLLFASWSQWEGGVCWGPRFLVPAMPALAVGVVEVVRGFGARTWRLPTRVALVAVMAVSVGVQLVGTTIGYEHHWNKVRPVAVARGEVQNYLYAWKYSPIVDEAKWAFSRTDLYVGRAMPPARRPGLFAGLMALSLLGAAAAVAGARRLDAGPAPAKPPDMRKNDPVAVPVL